MAIIQFQICFLFSFCSLSVHDTTVKEQVICSVDLGINTDAVCTIMRADGTVLGRRFINHPSEKDWMYRTLGRIRKFQREHVSAQSRGRWAYTKRLNIELGKKIAGAIIRYAEEKRRKYLWCLFSSIGGRCLFPRPVLTKIFHICMV